MNTHLEPIGRTIILPPSTRATATGLEWVSDPTSEELTAIDLMIQRCDGSVAWWMGDLVCKMIDLARAADLARTKERCSSLRAEASALLASGDRLASGKLDAEAAAVEASIFETAPERRGHMGEFIRAYSEARGLEKKTVEDRVLVANLFPPPARLAGLDWTHHCEVMQYAGGQGLAACRKWLTLALEGDGDGHRWPVSRLRAALRAANSLRARDEAEPDAPESFPREVSQFAAWAAIHMGDVERMTPSSARRLLDNIACAADFVDRLRLRAGGLAQSTGGREN